MKTVLITGGNRGIGHEIARQLDELGYTVILGSRNLEKGQNAVGNFSKNVIVKQLDVTNEDSIQRVFEFVKTDFGKLDVLINNAGLGTNYQSDNKSVADNAKNTLKTMLPGARKVSKVMAPILRKAGIIPQKESAEMVSLIHVKHLMETNFYGAWRMIQVFIPLLQKSNNGRIINVSSGMGELASLTGEYPAYSLSKSSLNALTILFSNELKDKGISVNATCPGWVRTDMGGPDAPRDVSQGADTAVWLASIEKCPTGKFFRDRQEINW